MEIESNIAVRSYPPHSTSPPVAQNGEIKYFTLIEFDMRTHGRETSQARQKRESKFTKLKNING